ncbi:hypothetical protein [Tychonema sp. LEGE 07203]|uniref:hypothetical protein n=1 Tax=Tychonema sp. LEGE 07203 TaxID=1828671 RepID=UPI00188237EA|nr:hypothetical protein [Tychonema sp. LEGE 07203]MBE9092871.1 hypothetical protein [Tychonema sp. LEGE 07203]
MKKNSWLSLTLLFVTYFILGWKLSEFDVPSHLTWFLAVTAVFVLSISLSFPLKDIKRLIVRWLSSDAGAFISIIVGAFLAVVVLTWMHIFVTGLVLISAGILARLDIQMFGHQRWRTFGILMAVSMTGLGLGGGIEFLARTGQLVLP